MSKVICLANQKGGCGKTTTAICLAQSLIRRGFKVLFVDTDSQCNSTRFYDAKSENMATVMDILCSDEDSLGCIQATNYGDIIPSDPMLKDVDIKVKDDSRRFLHLRNSIESAKEKIKITDKMQLLWKKFEKIIGSNRMPTTKEKEAFIKKLKE